MTRIAYTAAGVALGVAATIAVQRLAHLAASAAAVLDRMRAEVDCDVVTDVDLASDIDALYWLVRNEQAEERRRGMRLVRDQGDGA